jgi:hypothetical protein
MRLIAKRVALFCLLLTLWSAYAIGTHHHSSSADAVKCTVCVSANSASPVAASKLPSATFALLGVLVLEQHSPKQSYLVFALAIRPPPEI